MGFGSANLDGIRATFQMHRAGGLIYATPGAVVSCAVKHVVPLHLPSIGYRHKVKVPRDSFSHARQIDEDSCHVPQAHASQSLYVTGSGKRRLLLWGLCRIHILSSLYEGSNLW